MEAKFGGKLDKMLGDWQRAGLKADRFCLYCAPAYNKGDQNSCPQAYLKCRDRCASSFRAVRKANETCLMLFSVRISPKYSCQTGSPRVEQRYPPCLGHPCNLEDKIVSGK